jgi:rod shape-determining protein MreC
VLKKALLVVVLASILFFLRLQLYAGVQAAASYICYPLIYLQHFCIDPCKRSVQTDALVLQEAYEAMLQEYIKLQATADYYNQVKELIDFKQRYEMNHAQLAQIIERHLGSDEQYLLIDKGSHHGIHDRMVLVFKDMLVGRVLQVFPLFSKCILITDQRCKVGAYCAHTQAEGIIKGLNKENSLQMEHVSHLSVMQEHDMVISSGQGLIFPRGFGIARVSAYVKDDLVYQVSCEPLCDLRAIDYCYVIEKC